MYQGFLNSFFSSNGKMTSGLFEGLLILKDLFRDTPLTRFWFWHLNFQVPGDLCKVTGKVGKWVIPEKGSQNAV